MRDHCPFGGTGFVSDKAISQSQKEGGKYKGIFTPIRKDLSGSQVPERKSNGREDDSQPKIIRKGANVQSTPEQFFAEAVDGRGRDGDQDQSSWRPDEAVAIHGQGHEGDQDP